MLMCKKGKLPWRPEEIRHKTLRIKLGEKQHKLKLNAMKKNGK